MHLSIFIIFLAAAGNYFVMASPTLRSEDLGAKSVDDSLRKRAAIDNIAEKREGKSIDADAAYEVYERDEASIDADAAYGLYED